MNYKLLKLSTVLTKNEQRNVYGGFGDDPIGGGDDGGDGGSNEPKGVCTSDLSKKYPCNGTCPDGTSPLCF